MKLTSTTFVLLLLSIAAASCASRRSMNDVTFEDRVGIKGQEKFATLATSAGYRVIYVLHDKEAKICAEPSPDAITQLASTLGMFVDAGAKDKAALGAAFQDAFSTGAKQLFQRSQAVQFFRDATFAMCNAHLNNAFQDEKFLQEFRALRKDVAKILLKEAETKSQPIQSVDTSQAPPTQPLIGLQPRTKMVAPPNAAASAASAPPK